MTRKQKKDLKRGCIGITNLELSNDSKPKNPPLLKNAYSTFAGVQVAANLIDDDIKNNPQNYLPGTRTVIFSKRFWSNDRIGYVNFDYGLFDSRTKTWWHASHCHRCENMGKMTVYQSDLNYYSMPLLDFNRQIFVVTTTIIPSPK
jgi:hypothetical protein